MTLADAPARRALLRRRVVLEYATLAQDVIGIVVLATAAIAGGRWHWPGSAWIR